MQPTIFEKIINREIPSSIIYEDDKTIAILDINPKTLGHTLVIPKTVSRTFLEMDKVSLGHYFALVQKVAQAIKEALQADGLTIVLNVEEAGGQKVFHTHVHIIPRYTGDFVPMNISPHQSYSSLKEMDEYVEKIKSQLR